MNDLIFFLLCLVLFAINVWFYVNLHQVINLIGAIFTGAALLILPFISRQTRD